jgi:chemotaxis protein methyltransferase CheR
MTAVLDRSEIERFRSLVALRLGLQFDDGKLELLADVLRMRMESCACNRFPWYEQRLLAPATGREEIRALAEQLTVGETYFFRNRDHFRAFVEVAVPERIRARPQKRKLRILSAGCASGEEAYSLAILVRDRLPELAGREVEIRAIDINASMIEKAARSRYSAWALRDTPPDLREKYFHADGRDLVLDESLRAAVVFEERNLVEDHPSFWRRESFDIVFCRNVIMYFVPDVARTVVARIAHSLSPGGFLFLGHAETLRGISQEFHLRHTHETFYYQRREAGEARPEPATPQASPQIGWPVPALAAAEITDSWFDIIQRASERIASLAQGKGKPALERAHPAAPPAPWDRALAIELLRTERFAEALGFLKGLSPESRADPDAQLLLAVLLTNHGDPAEAESVCRKLIQLDELNAGAHYLIALCREHAGDRQAAAEHDQAAVYLDPMFAMPHLHLGLMSRGSGDLEAARRELGQALTLLAREDASRVLLFGGGFTREALAEFCRDGLRACGGAS